MNLHVLSEIVAVANALNFVKLTSQTQTDELSRRLLIRVIKNFGHYALQRTIFLYASDDLRHLVALVQVSDRVEQLCLVAEHSACSASISFFRLDEAVFCQIRSTELKNCCHEQHTGIL